MTASILNGGVLPTTAPTILGRLANALASLRDAAAKRALYVATLRELKALSEHELADIGIRKGDLRRLAYEAAYGK
jgi:uncharacterized protein YjiS (DUF1127 family)